VEITYIDGHKLTDELAVADAHPLGARPFAREDYIGKFRSLTGDWITPEEGERFITTAQRLDALRAEELASLNVALPPERLTCSVRDKRGIF